MEVLGIGVAFEKTDVLGSMSRGLKLMNNHRWRIFWLLLLVYLLGYLIGFIVLGILAVPIVLAMMFKNIITYILVGILCLVGLFILIFLGSYFFGPLTAIYYDLIIRKEGYDIQIQLADDGKSTPSQPAQI